MDSGSGLNLLYTRTYDAMGLSQAEIWPSNAPFYWVMPKVQVVPLGRVDLPVTFRSRANFQTKMITFEVTDLRGRATPS
jgi:hypothetical protein